VNEQREGDHAQRARRGNGKRAEVQIVDVRNELIEIPLGWFQRNTRSNGLDETSPPNFPVPLPPNANEA
jgi:hypothetical protein